MRALLKIVPALTCLLLLAGCTDDPPEKTMVMFLEGVTEKNWAKIDAHASDELAELLREHEQAGEWPDIDLYTVECTRSRNEASCRFCCLNNKFLFRYQGKEFYFTDRLVMERREGKWIVTGNK